MLRHGDVVQVSYQVCKPVVKKYVEHQSIDTTLLKTKGTIERSRSKFCSHPMNAMCEYCTPLEPYDPTYQKEQKIKFLSFHAYLRSVTHQDRTKPLHAPDFIAPLQVPQFVLRSCTNHEPYPKGICSKCQPSAITLTPQSFRMTDHVELLHDQVNEFIAYWRETGQQRFGLLIGKYQVYDGVPLGIKAVVEGIIEIEQESGHDYIQLLMLPGEAKWNRLEQTIRELGLEIIGCIYTDLQSMGSLM
jgi:nuclear protein localization family protein 4